MAARIVYYIICTWNVSSIVANYVLNLNQFIIFQKVYRRSYFCFNNILNMTFIFHFKKFIILDMCLSSTVLAALQVSGHFFFNFLLDIFVLGVG